MKSIEQIYENPGSILIVDDDELIRKILSKYLSDRDYIVETAHDGQAAIEKLNDKSYDLVLTDLRMPHMGGRELLQLMSANYPTIPKIVLTGYGTNDDIILALKTGAYDFLTKPITDFAILNHAIERAIEKKRLNDERNRYVEQLKQINEIISMLNRGKSTEEIFQSLKIVLKNVIPFNVLMLIIIQNLNNLLVTKNIGADNELFSSMNPFPIDSIVFERIVDHKEIFRIPQIEQYLISNPDSKSMKIFLSDGIRSALFLPLIINDEVRGFLLFGSRTEDAFKQHHITFIESIVGQIAFSLQRGELLHEIEQHTKNLEHIVDLRTQEVIKTQKTTIFALSKLAETRDPETGGHLERIRSYSVLLAQILKYTGHYPEITNQYLRDLYDSSILHDIGKVGIPDCILLKNGSLTEYEFEIMKKHTIIGRDALKQASKDLGEDSFLKMAMDITLYHHECWNGIGYPAGIKERDIPLSARIVAIVDVYDAMTSRRPYKDAETHEQSIEMIKEEENKFDPSLLRAFLENADEFNKIRYQRNN